MVFRLFREEAVLHAGRRLSGEVVLAAPLGLRVVSLTLLALLAAAITFAASATYTRKETLAGVVVPRGGLVRAVARSGGLVASLEVTTGQQVVEGQVLARISRANFTSRGDSGALSSGVLATELQSIISDGEASRAILLNERARLQRDLQSLSQEGDEAQTRLEVQAQQLELAAAELERAQQIADRGFLPLREVESRRATVLNAQSQLSSLRSAVLAQRRERRQVEQEVSQYDRRLALLNGETSRALAGIDQRRIELERTGSYLLVAPASGVVSALPARVGYELAPGGVAAVISRGTTPQTFVAEVLIPSSASGFLKPGQSVRISVDAFPHQRYGRINGTLEEISGVPLQAEDLRDLGATAQTPVYRGVVRIEEQGLLVRNEIQPLRAGMTLTADVATERRSILRWLLDPLLAALNR